MTSPARKKSEAADAPPTRRARAAAPAARSAEPTDRAGAAREHTTLWDRPGFLVRRLHQIHVALFMEDPSDEPVTPIQYGLLSILVDTPGLDQFSVAEEYVLKRLESRKLVLRVVDPHNKRRKICLPTRTGVAFVKRFRPRMQRAQERLLEPLTAEERHTFVYLLHKLIDANNVHGRAVLRPSRGLRAKASLRRSGS